MKKQKKQAKQAKQAASEKAVRRMPGWAAPALIAVCVVCFYWIPITSGEASIQWDAADLHYPLQKYFSDRLFSGSLPFWTPYLFSGYPILANPEVGAWYLPHWPLYIAGITPGSILWELVFNAFLACFGAYLFFSRLVTNRSAAVMGAFAYGLSGFFAGHSSHVGLFSAASCFPWLLLAYQRATEGAALRYTALGGIAGGLMILAGYVQIAMYGFLGLGLYALADLYKRRRWIATPLIVAGMLAGALAFAAIQILPGLELTSHSIRAGADYSTSTEGVLQMEPLLTLIVPDWLGASSGNYRGPFDITQYYYYAGLLLLPLAAIGAVKSRTRFPALVLMIPALWYMLGPAGGFYRLGGILPGLHKVRAPIQGWFIVALALALLAAAGSQWIFGRWRSPLLKVAAIGLLLIDVWYWNSYRNPMAYARSSYAELYGRREENARERVAATQPPLNRFDAPRNLGALGPFNHPLNLKLETTYGYFALEPTAFSEYVQAMAKNPKLLDGLNVSRVLNGATGGLTSNPSVLPRAYFPKAMSDLSGDDARNVLETIDPALSSVASLPHQPVQQDPAAKANIAYYDEQSYRVQYQAASPSLLKLSVAWYPGWHAFLGQTELPVIRVDHALMGVVVPAGEGEVEFRFRSRYFTLGLGITLAAALALAALAWIGRSSISGRKHISESATPAE